MEGSFRWKVCGIKWHFIATKAISICLQKTYRELFEFT